jgi:hypothetical protein
MFSKISQTQKDKYHMFLLRQNLALIIIIVMIIII